jgi:hypothetical protein
MRRYLSRNSDNYGQEEVEFIHRTKPIGSNAIGESQGLEEHHHRVFRGRFGEWLNLELLLTCRSIQEVVEQEAMRWPESV